MPTAANSAPVLGSTYRRQQVDPVDLRTIPSIVGGDPRTRPGIALTESIPTKHYGIQTRETLYAAIKK